MPNILERNGEIFDKAPTKAYKRKKATKNHTETKTAIQGHKVLNNPQQQ